jgi:hypothetical protein
MTSESQKLNTACPKCNSSNTQSFEMAYQAGTTSGHVQVTSYSEGGGLGVTGGKVRNQSLLAAKVAPPNPPEGEVTTGFISFLVAAVMASVASFVLYLAVALFGYDIIGKLVGVFSAIVFTIWWTFLIGNNTFSNRKIREEQYNSAMRQWKQGWICLRCGKDWQPRPDAVSKVRMNPEIAI